MSTQPCSLGALIALLETQPFDNSLRFDFGYMAPDGIGSYRGYYDHLALSYGENAEMTVEGLLTMLREADGATYEGYKGGTFRMSKQTPVWVANYGDACGTVVTGLAECSYMTILATGFCDDWSGSTESAAQMFARITALAEPRG